MKKYFSEFFGTFILVFFGTGAIILNEVTEGAITHIGISLTFGLTVTLVIYVLGNISGAHINPAVSFTLWTKRNISGKVLTGYVISQCAGALLASTIMRVAFPSSVALGSTLPAGTSYQSFFIELGLSFALMLGILQAEKISTGKILTISIVVGLIVGLEAFFAGPITGASMNPARSLAPALVSGHTESLWVYILAPVIGCWLGSKVNSLLS